MYLGKPLLMVPAHIEQDCNAYDAARSGAGVVSDRFDLERLLAFAADYHPDVAFRYWVRSCDRRILYHIENSAPLSHYPVPTFPYSYFKLPETVL